MQVSNLSSNGGQGDDMMMIGMIVFQGRASKYWGIITFDNEIGVSHVKARYRLLPWWSALDPYKQSLPSYHIGKVVTYVASDVIIIPPLSSFM